MDVIHQTGVKGLFLVSCFKKKATDPWTINSTTKQVQL